MRKLRVFVGYDNREDIAYQVCKKTLLKHSSISLDIVPIKQQEMRDRNLYWREHDPFSATEFSFTRFLMPYLVNYQGWALFLDCDFLIRGDIAQLLNYVDDEKACFVVKHNYQPPELTKMDNKKQHQYPRKNWSSFMFVNCGHEQTKVLTPEIVNRESGMYLHRFAWLSDDVIGELPITWNYLEGWHSPNDCINPIAVHFTRGGPWFKDYMDVEYGKEWLEASQ